MSYLKMNDASMFSTLNLFLSQKNTQEW